MNILLISSSLIYITLQQCAETGVTQCNSQLRSGLLPTYLFEKVFKVGLPNKLSPPVQIIQNGWNLTADHFLGEAIIENQTYTGQQGVGEGGQITVSNPTILIEIGFLFQNGTIQNGQGFAILESVSSASYTFAINTQTNPYKYNFILINSEINFNNAIFRAIYANFPHEIGQIQELLSALNTNQLIQTALTQYYNNQQNGLNSILKTDLSNFEILSKQNSTKTYRDGLNRFNYQVYVNQVQIQYAPVSYAISAQMNIEQLQTKYTCNYPINTICTVKQNINIEQISMDQIINTFYYAYQKNMFNTKLNPSNWKVPFFSWSTGGLNNIMNNVYTSFAYSTQIGGTCNAISANYVNYTINYFTVAIQFACNITINTNVNILSFTVDLEKIEVELDFSMIKEQAAFKIKKVSTPNIVFQAQGNYTIDNQNLLQWYIEKALDKSFVGQRFYGGIIDSQRNLDSEQITYEIQNGIITITNIKK